MKKGKNSGNVMNKLTREVQSQYLPQKIKDKQMIDNPQKMEKELAKLKDKNYKSTLEYTGGVEEYLAIAKLANKKYEPLQEQVVLQNIHVENQEIKPNEFNRILLENTTKNSEVHSKDMPAIQIPKRPKWVPGVKPREFEMQENEAYLNWRRALSELEQNTPNMIITPYEKNIAVWRQLWIVIEKCQVLIQIVDGRNPLFFRSADLENYIKEIDIRKDYLLLVNKADLLSEEMRISWASYFKENGIKYIFFSALTEDLKLEEIEEIVDVGNTKTESKNPILEKYSDITENDYKIQSRSDLIKIMRQMTNGKEMYHNSKTHMIGFIGYPNVGKSSVINVLMKKKRVGVAMMPGKTKHYQTLFMPNEPDLCLMDCPGLVFPSFTFSKADLVVNGIVPIDKIIDFLIPIQLIIYHIPKPILEKFYKIKLPDLYSSSQFLQVLATKQNFLTGRSLPNESKVAKIVLKDFVSGDVLYCHKRPDYDRIKHGDIEGYLYKSLDNQEKIKESQDMLEVLKQIPAGFDDDYEKLGMEVGDKKVLPNYQDLDKEFFNQEDTNLLLKDAKVPKEMRMQLKFAVKRGEILEEDYENIDTFEEAKEILDEIEKNKSKIKDNNQLGQKKQL